MSKLIQLIDDDEDILLSLQLILESKGYKVITATESKSGYTQLLEENPDFLVLDVMMDSNLEGYNLLHKIKKNKAYQNLPIIILTGMRDQIGVNLYSAVEDEKMFPNVRFKDKPIDPLVLADLIKEMLP